MENVRTNLLITHSGAKAQRKSTRKYQNSSGHSWQQRLQKYLQTAQVVGQRLGDVGESTTSAVQSESLAVAFLGTKGQLYSVFIEGVAIVGAQEDEAQNGEREEVHGGDGGHDSGAERRAGGLDAGG